MTSESTALILRLVDFKYAADVAPQRKSPDEREIAVERLREFLRLNYITGSDVARQMGVADMTLHKWLSGESRPRNPKRITAFLESMPAESGGCMREGHRYQLKWLLAGANRLRWRCSWIRWS